MAGSKTQGMTLLISLLFHLLIFSNMQSPYASQRTLLIFGKEQHPTLVQQQLNLLNKQPAALKERELVIRLVAKGSSLEKEFNISPAAFMVVLIGKDRTEKHRTSQLLEPSELFAMIDAMPMRRAALRKKN
jgi:hypothetical protein